MKNKKFDESKARKAISLLLEAFGENPDRRGIEKTSARVAEFYKEFLSAGWQKPPKSLPLRYDGIIDEEIVFLKDITFHSICEHHLLPFFGKIHIAYMPQNGAVAGISKLARIAQIYSQRLQLQERLSKQIADALTDLIAPLGLMIIIEAQHLCMSMRGVKQPEAKVITSEIRGIFKDDEKMRNQALSILRD